MNNCTILDCNKKARGAVYSLYENNPITNGEGDILILQRRGWYKVCEDHMILLQEFNSFLNEWTTFVYGLPH